MKAILSYLKYSGIWVGLVVNPFHWQLGWKKNVGMWPDDYMFDNSMHFGPIWLRVIIDDGRW